MKAIGYEFEKTQLRRSFKSSLDRNKPTKEVFFSAEVLLAVGKKGNMLYIKIYRTYPDARGRERGCTFH